MPIDVDSRIPLFPLDELTPGTACHAVALGVDLVVVRPQSGPETVVVLYGRCQHRGALLADGEVREPYISCTLHGSTYRLCTGKNIYYPGADLTRFTAGVTEGQVWVDMAEVAEWARKNPQRFRRDEYQGSFADHKGTPDEPHRDEIHQLAAHGLSRVGHHGPVGAMGVPGPELPRWAGHSATRQTPSARRRSRGYRCGDRSCCCETAAA